MTYEELQSVIKFDANGLIVAIIQDFHTKKVRMQGFMNKKSLALTFETGYIHFFSRSRNMIWKKGEESKNYQLVKNIYIDCDCDSLLFFVEQVNNITCHTGSPICFYRSIEGINYQILNERVPEIFSDDILLKLENVVKDRKHHPKEGSYTNYLITQGVEKISKKIGEEASEVIIAACKESKENLVNELADLLYHLTVLMVEKGVSVAEVKKELDKR